MASSLGSRVGIHAPRAIASARDSASAFSRFDGTGAEASGAGSGSGGNIRVAVRIRPFLPNEIEQEHALSRSQGGNGEASARLIVDREQNAIQVPTASKVRSFAVDRVFDDNFNANSS